MKAPRASVLSMFLALAALLTLSSCRSLETRGSGLTPRSEAVCDQAPPAVLPPVPTTEPERSAWVRILLGLYEWEVDKSLLERPCRAKVRAENAAAFDRLK